MISLLYEDSALVVVDKPAGAVIHRTAGATDAPVLHAVLRRQLGYRVWPVHRLDRPTSGALVFARSADAASRLCAQLREGIWHKRYVALCRGVIGQELVVDHPARCGSKRKPAQTRIIPLEQLCGRYTFARAEPQTGRYHQIRYHFKHIGHPLVGDTTYGKGSINRFFRATFGLHRLFLHAEQLAFPHPYEPRRLCIAAPMPAMLEAVISELRCYGGAVA